MDDIVDVLDESDLKFGLAAQQRYAALLEQAVRDVTDDPFGPQSKDRPDLGEGVRTWHLRASRDRVHGDKVGQPRHFLIYRVVEGEVQIGRVAFERRHLPGQVDDDVWE